MDAKAANDPQAVFGGLLRRYRVAAGLTQEELAERAGLSVRGLRYLERGLHRPYRDTVQRLIGALDVTPDDLGSLISAARPRPVAAESGERPAAGDLPVPPTPVVGRERDVATVSGLLDRSDVRVLTLTGPGGVGKTRLALEVATHVRPPLTGGVVWVPLGALADPGLVASAIVDALGLVEAGARPALEALTIALEDRPVLLLLDNFEHLAPAAGLVSDLVAGCPQLKVLVTSRAPLRLRSEREFPVSPLPTPAETGHVSLYALASNPAVELFLRQAQAVRPDFILGEANAAAVAAICRRLEGLPLALELAAARVRVLSPQTMLARLEHRLAFLRGGGPDLPPRQRTMRAAIAWSHDLLSPGAATLFRRLAVFDGGCSLPDIEAVCGSVGPNQPELLDGVEELQRTSLLGVGETADEEPRFHLLETVREFALERLAVSGEESTVRRRHAEHYLAFAERAALGFYSPATAVWLDRVAQEHDNLRSVFRWCSQQHDTETALRLAGALWSFWYVRGHVTEGRALLANLLDIPDASTLAAPRAEALLGAGQLAQTQGDYDAAALFLHESIALRRQLDDQRGTAAALLAAGFVARVQERYTGAIVLLEEARRLAQDTGHRFVVAATLHHLGMIAADFEHDYAAARGLLEESLSLYRDLGLPRFVALLLLSLGDVAHAEGDLGRAHQLLNDGLTTMSQLEERLGVHGALDSLGHLAVSEGEAERAVRLAGAAERLRATDGTASWPVVERSRTEWLGCARRTLDENAYQTAWSAGQAMTRHQAIAYALTGAATL